MPVKYFTKSNIIFSTLFAFLFICFEPSYSQDSLKAWKYGGNIAANFNQVAFSNWSLGGENTFAGAGYINLFANFKQGEFIWDNLLELGYGLTYSSEFGTRKNDDKINLNSKAGYKAFGKFYYSGLFSFKSQFAKGYNYPNDSVVVSKFMAPAYITLSLGMDYVPSEIFSLYFSPCTGKLIVINDDSLANQGTFTGEAAVRDSTGKIIQPGVKSKFDFGALLRAAIKYEIMKNVTLESKISLFDNYTDKVKENRLNIEIDWTTNVLLKVNSLISATIFLQMIYDHNIKVPIYEQINGVKTQVGTGPRLQVKEALGIGFSYKL